MYVLFVWVTMQSKREYVKNTIIVYMQSSIFATALIESCRIAVLFVFSKFVSIVDLTNLSVLLNNNIRIDSSCNQLMRVMTEIRRI